MDFVANKVKVNADVTHSTSYIVLVFILLSQLSTMVNPSVILENTVIVLVSMFLMKQLFSGLPVMECPAEPECCLSLLKVGSGGKTSLGELNVN